MKPNDSRRRTSHLTSHRNALVRQSRDLKRRRYREESGKFRIEGSREIDRAIDGGIEIEYVLYCDSISRFKRAEDTLQRIKSLIGVEVHSTSSSVFANLSQWQNPDGLLAVAKKSDVSLEALEASNDDIFLVIDGVEKPGNLGSMFRTVDAVGCRGILISDPVVELFNPNVIRASLGTVFTTTCAVAKADDLIEWLRKHGLKIVSSSPSGSLSYIEAPLGSGCAVVIGSEKDGLNESWFKASDVVVKLPNEGFADSINAAMAANALLFESYRQSRMKLRSSGFSEI